MRFCLALILFSFCCTAGAEAQKAEVEPEKTDAQAQKNEEHPDFEVTVVMLNKDQLGALAVAIREMRKINRSFRGQQVRIEDQGKNFQITFMNDPIDMRVAGSQNGITWQIRKSDLRVLRWFLDR